MDWSAQKGLASWLVNLGWDACVLSLGAAPAVFMSEAASGLCGGHEVAVYWGFAYVLSSIIVAGGVVGGIRRVESKHDSHALVALAVGGALLGSLTYIARWTPSHPLAPVAAAIPKAGRR